jgi:hypothetical protein
MAYGASGSWVRSFASHLVAVTEDRRRPGLGVIVDDG